MGVAYLQNLAKPRQPPATSTRAGKYQRALLLQPRATKEKLTTF